MVFVVEGNSNNERFKIKGTEETFYCRFSTAKIILISKIYMHEKELEIRGFSIVLFLHLSLNLPLSNSIVFGFCCAFDTLAV